MKFTNKDLSSHAGYLYWRNPADKADRRFVARFKYGGMVQFKKFLRENFTVEEYFELTGKYEMDPLHALQTKGYISPNQARALEIHGFEKSLKGLNQYLAWAVEQRKAA